MFNNPADRHRFVTMVSERRSMAASNLSSTPEVGQLAVANPMLQPAKLDEKMQVLVDSINHNLTQYLAVNTRALTNNLYGMINHLSDRLDLVESQIQGGSKPGFRPFGEGMDEGRGSVFMKSARAGGVGMDFSMVYEDARPSILGSGCKQAKPTPYNYRRVLGGGSKGGGSRLNSNTTGNSTGVLPTVAKINFPKFDGHNCNGNSSSFLPIQNSNGLVDGNAVCMIKNLDNGKEILVKEVREDGTWQKIKELETGRQLTMEEFSSEMCVGTSPIVQELMRSKVEDKNEEKEPEEVKMNELEDEKVIEAAVEQGELDVIDLGDAKSIPQEDSVVVVGKSALEYGSRSLRKLGSSYLGGDEDSDLGGKQDETLTKFGLDDSEDSITPKSFPVCDDRHSELIPCLDRNRIYQMRLKLDLSLMEYYKRNCPLPERRFNCLIPPAPGYKVPIKWPKSRDEVWKANIPHTHLAHEKSDQNWMVVKGDKINFPGGGTHFHYGADKYIAHLANMLNFPNNVLNNEGRLRTVFDVGCGVASFGGYLLSSDIIAMSLAPNDVHQNQIQFALERGIPAYLGVLGTKRLPYPSRSFELAHCSRCRIDWLQRDGILLLELDRLLRPGGYFAYSSPEAYAQDEEDLRIWREMSALVERMCWRIAVKKNQTVIWQKPLTNDCFLEREPGTQPPLCRSDDDPDAVWGVPMEACITPYSDHDHKTKGSGLAPWPARLTTPPPRLADFGYSTDMFEKDMELWRRRVDNYWSLLSPKISSDTIRNIMDMKANLGSFASALKDKDVWVMNVVPEDGPKTLKIVYDRGLIGSVHNWCEAFSTYPRTYDMLHAWNVLSDIEKKGCSGEDLLLEVDRILRPTGFAIFRDRQPIIDFVKKYLGALHWEAVATGESNPEDGDEVVLIIQKKVWLTSESFRDAE